MLRMIAGIVLAAASLVGCGGGGDGGSVAPAAKTMKLSLYGQPLVIGSKASSKAQLLAVANAASSAPATSSDAAASVQALQAALAARGVTANVTAQVMDGTTLHQIVVGENNGLPPTPDQFKTDPSEYLVVNFELDDMASRTDDPTQAAAINQFIQDLTVFAQRASVSGKLVLAIAPILTCDQPPGFSAAYGLQYAITQASSKALIQEIGGVPLTIGYDSSGNVIQTPELAHLGADCRTPDAYLLDARTQAAADAIAALYKQSAGTATAASGASATGT